MGEVCSKYCWQAKDMPAGFCGVSVMYLLTPFRSPVKITQF